MAVPKNASEAIAQRLLTDQKVVKLIGDRVTPNIPDTDPNEDYVVFQRISGGGSNTLGGRAKLQGYTYRLDVYAQTDEAAETILEACTDRLFGNERKSIPPWRELGDGVQACIAQDDMDADTLPDAAQVNGQTFTLWFAPQ